MTVVHLRDGRILQGLILTQNEKTVTIQTHVDRQTLPRDAIESLHITTLSPMPDGLLDKLSPADVRDLVGYLRHPSQVERAVVHHSESE
jgi:putative heme-binding domain-containing protein